MFFSYKGKRIYYSDSGKGKALVLLLGYLESSEVWNGFAEKLSSEFRVISIDLPANARVVVLKKTGHMGFIEEEKLALKVVSDFVNNIT